MLETCLDVLPMLLARSHDLNISRSCFLLLSDLPQNLPLPSSAEDFFFKALNRALQRPSQSTFRSLCRLLDGPCVSFFGLSAESELRRFDRQLEKLIRNLDGLDMVWCMRTVVIFAQHTRPSFSSDAYRALFSTPRREHMVLTSLAEGSISACSGGYLSPEDAIEDMHIATKISALVDATVQEQWPQHGNEERVLYEKL